jgi:hypothetical protein
MTAFHLHSRDGRDVIGTWRLMARVGPIALVLRLGAAGAGRTTLYLG